MLFIKFLYLTYLLNVLWKILIVFLGMLAFFYSNLPFWLKFGIIGILIYTIKTFRDYFKSSNTPQKIKLDTFIIEIVTITVISIFILSLSAPRILLDIFSHPFI